MGLFISLKTSDKIPTQLDFYNTKLIPEWFLNEFDPQNFTDRVLRLEIWQKAVEQILNKPLFGWGAATFPILFESTTGGYVSHPHNLFLELALSHGLPISIFIFSLITFITVLSFKKIYATGIRGNFVDISEKAWFSSFFVLLCSQLIDIQYFDGRISISFWILLAGLKRIITPKKQLDDIACN